LSQCDETLNAQTVSFPCSHSGGIDETFGNQTLLEEILDAGTVTWEITRYSGVPTDFSVFSSDNYSLKADARSWTSAMALLQSVVPVPEKLVVDTEAPTVSPLDATGSPTSAPDPGTSTSSPSVGAGNTESPTASSAPGLTLALEALAASIATLYVVV